MPLTPAERKLSNTYTYQIKYLNALRDELEEAGTLDNLTETLIGFEVYRLIMIVDDIYEMEHDPDIEYAVKHLPDALLQDFTQDELERRIRNLYQLSPNHNLKDRTDKIIREALNEN